MKKKIIKIFIASSGEQLPVARNIQSNINRLFNDIIKFDSVVWDEKGVFEKGEFGLTSLIASIRKMDFAIIILTPDDKLLENDKGKIFVPRDNLLFELGLCQGLLGLKKVLALKDKRLKKSELLSDYGGLTYIEFDNEDVKTNTGTLSVAISEIVHIITKRTIENLENGNYFKNKMILWRKNREEFKFLEIKNGSWTIKALNESKYKRYVFQGVLSVLEEGDKYLTVSNLAFWTTDEFDIDRFIDNNVEALQRGVDIQRVILLDSSVFNSNNDEESFRLVERVVEKFEKLYHEDEALFSKMKLLFLICDDYRSVIGSDPIPYAIIENSMFNDFALIKPDYDRPITKEIKIDFFNFANKENAPENYRELKNKFSKLMKNPEVKDIIAIRMKINEIKSRW